MFVTVGSVIEMYGCVCGGGGGVPVCVCVGVCVCVYVCVCMCVCVCESDRYSGGCYFDSNTVCVMFLCVQFQSVRMRVTMCMRVCVCHTCM